MAMDMDMNTNEDFITVSQPSSAAPTGPAAINNHRRRQQQSYDHTKSFLLGKRMKSTLSDGRTLTGTFICIDRLKNLILTDVTEERMIDPSDYRYRVGDGDGDNNNNNNGDNDGNNDDDDINPMDGRVVKVERHISQAMIPGSRLVKVEIATSI